MELPNIDLLVTVLVVVSTWYCTLFKEISSVAMATEYHRLPQATGSNLTAQQRNARINCMIVEATYLIDPLFSMEVRDT